MPLWETKCWGRVMHLFSSPHAAVSCLETDAGYRSSWHVHQHRANLFLVQEGIVVIEHRGLSVNGEVRQTLLRTGDQYTARSGSWHRFRVVESGRMTEVYFADHPDSQGLVRADDIIRHDEGGVDDLKGLRRLLGLTEGTLE